MIARYFMSIAMLALIGWPRPIYGQDDYDFEEPRSEDEQPLPSDINLNQHQTVLVIPFDSGKGQVSPTAKEAIRNFMEQTVSQGDIAELYLAVWADVDPFNPETVDVGENQLTLAAQRLKNLRSYFEINYKNFKITSFNMVKPSGFWASLIGTKDYRLKQALLGEEVSLETELSRIIEKARVSSAVLSVRYKKVFINPTGRSS